MDFFAHQDQAKAASKRLSLLFILAVGFLSLLLTLVIFAASHEMFLSSSFLFYAATGSGSKFQSFFANLAWQRFIGTFLVTSGILFAISYFRLQVLKRGGGANLAMSLGGHLLFLGPNNSSEEKRLLNIVEEMALASGVPTPPVYILEDETINAFAAGNTIQDAVVGVTKGAMTGLNRQQLQGIIAHEFSHILHGDMGLNLRMIGVLFGIMFFQKIGYHILRSSGRGRNKQAGPFLTLGVGFLLFGSLGYLLASFIRAAISRQREFLADASAVQFTRDPQGISEALSKAAGFTMISSPNAGEAAHMFFLTAVKGFFAEPFALHPGVSERIKRIGYIDTKRLQAQKAEGTAKAGSSGKARASSLEQLGAVGAAGFLGNSGNSGVDTTNSKGPAALADSRRLSPQQVLDSIGSLQPKNVVKAASFMTSLPEAIQEALHSAQRSAELVFSLAIHDDPAQRAIQKQLLEKYLDQAAIERVLGFTAARQQGGSRLAFLHIALPVMRRLSGEELKTVQRILNELVWSDQKVELFEFLLVKNVEKYLTVQGDVVVNRQQSPLNKIQLTEILLAMMARLGAKNDEEAKQSYNLGLASLGFNEKARRPLPLPNSSLLEAAMFGADRLKPNDKKSILEALAKMASLDGVLAYEELELLRGLSTYIGCPMPSVAV